MADISGAVLLNDTLRSIYTAIQQSYCLRQNEYKLALLKECNKYQMGDANKRYEALATLAKKR